ncbi:MAG: PhnD/SsuA/transferrin family substrate-binding protein [Chamaesiphon sp.]
MLSRRLFLLQLILFLASCVPQTHPPRGKLTIGLVSYGEGIRSVDQLAPFGNYLAAQIKILIELEPVYNEIRALEQIERKSWSLVFAPAGLAAIAIAKEHYLPLFPMQGINNSRSVIVVLNDSPLQKLADLTGKVFALGELGSATGYYLPIYNLYGMTLAEVRFAPTPRTVLEWIEKKEVTAGALSKAEFDQYRPEFSQGKFRVLYTDPHSIPSGAVIVGPTVERNQQEQIRMAMRAASPTIVQAAGYIPTGSIPDYKYLIQVIERVKPIAGQIHQKPAHLY